jgi:Flp pilus assembly protein TadD
MALGEAAFLDERYEEAASCFARAAQSNPNFSTAYFCRAYALALEGRVEEARPWANRGLELEPGYQIRMFFQWGIAPMLVEKLVKGARLLGLPE